VTADRVTSHRVLGGGEYPLLNETNANEFNSKVLKENVPV